MMTMEGSDPGDGGNIELPIEVAVKHGNLEAVKELLKFGAHIKGKDSEKDTLLHIAARAGHDK